MPWTEGYPVSRLTQGPRDPVIDRALHLTHEWLHGRTLNEEPALNHALGMARMVKRHMPQASVMVQAAALLSCTRHWVPLGARRDRTVDAQVTPGVADILRQVEDEHRYMMCGLSPQLPGRDAAVVSAADKILTWRRLVSRSRRCANAELFWDSRPTAWQLLPWQAAWAGLAVPLMPPTLGRTLYTTLSVVQGEVGPQRVVSVADTSNPAKAFIPTQPVRHT